MILVGHKEPYSYLIQNCPIQRLMTLLGKRWTFPLLCRLEHDGEYTFEEFVEMTCRRINRSALSSMLKGLVELNIIEHKKNRYRFTDYGKQLKEHLHGIQYVTTRANPESYVSCDALCRRSGLFRDAGSCHKA